MTIQKCRYCQKEVGNLAAHIIRIHPSIVEQLEERDPGNPPLSPQTPLSPPNSANFAAQNMRIGGITQMIQEKLDIMLNIKIIEMLSKNPNTSIQEIATALNPPQKTTIEELKEYHNLVYGDDKIPHIETGNQWIDIAQQAIPIIKEMLPIRKTQIGQGGINVRQGNTTNPGILKPIQFKAPGDPGESISDRKEPGAFSDTE